MNIIKKINKIVSTTEYVAKSSLARHLAVNFLVMASASALINNFYGDGEFPKGKAVMGSIAISASGFILAYAINNSFDTILERVDDENQHDYYIKTKS